MTETISDTLHFIGIGGVGMSGIASVAAAQGMRVSGSDMKTNRYTRRLVREGVQVFIGHDAANLPDDDDATIVISTAILPFNAELQEAKRRNMKVIHRAQMLAALGRGLETLAVAGTHGKTTTSSMLTTVLDAMGEDPTFLIGGTVRQYQTNSHSGRGRFYVVEADESDKSFTELDPVAAIVTNIEPDHLDHYDGVDEIYFQFSEFMRTVPESGPVVVCGEDERLVQTARESASNVVTYGFDAACDAQIVACESEGVSTRFTLRLPGGAEVRSCIKQSPGRHNVLNGAAVLTLIDALGLDVDAAAAVLGEFEGVCRRFELAGEAAGVTVIDDYAHHPTEIAATVHAAKQLGFERVHVLFQPHRYSRAPLFTEVLRDEFGAAFDEADTVTFMNVYSAGEVPVPGITGKTFLSVVLEHDGHPEARYIPKVMDAAPAMAEIARPGDLILTMGAGDVTDIGPIILTELAEG